MEIIFLSWADTPIFSTYSLLCFKKIILVWPNLFGIVDYYNIIFLVLNKYRFTLKLKKFIFYKDSHRFVVIKVYNHGNDLAKVNMDDLYHITALIICFDVRMLIVMFWSYATFIPMFELRILPLHQIIKQNQQDTNGGNYMPHKGLWN